MNLEIRPNTWEEFPTLKKVNARAQNNFYVDSDVQRFGIIFEPERSVCAFEEGRIVGCTTSYSLEMMVPGGTVPIGAVAQVSVQATHRRRGINTKLMRRQLTDMHEWGDSLAVLQASESVIYGRYGYGMGSFEYTFELERPHGAFSRRYEPKGRVLFIEEDEAREVFPPVFERATLLRNGMVKRNDTWWKFRFVQSAMRGADPRAWFVKYEVDGRPDGYVWFTIKEAHLMTVKELVTATDDAYAALWQFCFDMDLVTTVTADRRAADEPLPWLMADPRRLKQTFKDASWFRLVDVPAALSARTYSANDGLVLRVLDPFLEWNDGRVRLDGGPEGADCRATDEEPDLTLSAADLGAVYLGGVKFRTLYHAGRVEENTPGALARADAMFATDLMPWCIDSW